MAPRDTIRRLAAGSARIWRRLPERWRRRTFETVPFARSAALRLRASLHDGEPALLADPGEVAAPPVDGSGQPYFKLREQDVHGAYRLLLHRDPTPAEMDRHLQQGATNLEYDMYHFVDLLLSSPERERALADLDEPRVALLDGLTFHYRPYDTALGAMVAHVGAYETEVARAIERLLPAGGTFVDVGANIGLHAIRAARAVGAGGTVICFEPNPGNVELLTLTMTANQFDQVTIRPVAASDRPGVVPLHARRGQSNGTVEEGTIRWPSDVQVDVPSVRLDDELAGIDRLDLLKIDIEGAEPLAFAGMAETLARFKPPILMEVFPDALRRTSGVEPAAFLEHVASIGYQMLPMIPGQGEPNEVRSIESILALPVEHSVTHVDVLAVPS